MTQSSLVAELITLSTGRAVELVEVITQGDTSTASLTTIGGTGVFASALRAALENGEVDLAVHSLKDLPTAPVPALALAAVPEREDPRDALVAAGGATLATLPRGARVGTGSPRRAAQLLAARPDLQVVDVRGNVPRRLEMVTSGDLDAIVLARAGLVRLGLEDQITEVLDPEVLLPAPGQGALAVECRADDAVTAAACAGLDHALTRAEVTAERALLAALEAGCTSPVGALARADTGGSVHLRAVVLAADGSVSVARSASAAAIGAEVSVSAAALGCDVASALLADGAATLVDPDALAEPPAPTPSTGGGRDTGRDRPRPPSPAPHDQHRTAAEHTGSRDEQHDTAADEPSERRST